MTRGKTWAKGLTYGAIQATKQTRAHFQGVSESPVMRLHAKQTPLRPLFEHDHQAEEAKYRSA